MRMSLGSEGRYGEGGGTDVTDVLQVPQTVPAAT